MVNRQENKFRLIEDLCNELFVEIFSYLNGVDTVFAFSCLNKRFETLLRKYCKLFDFKSKNKLQFDTIFDEFSTKKWNSLQLSNDDHTPGQIEYCFQRCPLTIYFIKLKSLSLLEMKPINESILIQLTFLTNLISLKIQFICGKTMSKFNFSDLKQLKRLVITSCFNSTWINNFSQIEILDYTVFNCCFDQMILIWPSKLRHLKITFENAKYGELLPQSLRNLFQLISLKIYQKEVGYSHPNGQIWEELIRSSCPLLKKFQFCFQFPYWSFASNEIRQMIASFSTPFYINEKKWFVRCDTWTDDRKAVLYSLPYTFDSYTMFSGSFDESIFTNPNDYSNNTNKNVKTLVCKSFPKSDEYSHGIRMFELIQNDYFNSIEQLHLFSIFSPQSTAENMNKLSKKFCILLENLPYLYSLDIHIDDLQAVTNNWTNISVCNHLSRKVRSLRLYQGESSLQSLTENILEQIIRIFTLKCQHLLIHISSSVDIIISILRYMQQLYSLQVPVQIKNDVKITMKWLEQQHIGLNYSNCLIVNHHLYDYFWLGRY